MYVWYGKYKDVDVRPRTLEDECLMYRELEGGGGEELER